MNQALSSILLRRRRMLVASPGPSNPSKKAVFLIEAYALGFLVDNPEAYSDAMLDDYSQVMPALARLRGARATHVPLYSEFPDRVPEQGAYLTKRLIGYVINSARWDVPGKVTESGYVIPEWLFELEHFGANPITQMQDLGLFLKAKFAQVTRSKEEPKSPTRLSIVTPDEAADLLTAWCRRCLCSKTSYPDDYRRDFSAILEAYGDLGLTPTEVKFREHRAMLSAYLWRGQQWDKLTRFCQTPNDLLRTFAALTETDVALVKPVKYPRLSRLQRRFVLSRLEAMASTDLVEDQLHKYRDLWLRIARGLHSHQYARHYPKAAGLLAKLRSGQTRPRFSALEAALGRGDQSAIVAELARFPDGVTVRRFTHALAAVPAAGREALLSTLMARVEKSSLKDLLMLCKVTLRDTWATQALVLTSKGTTQVIQRQPARLAADFRQRVARLLEEKLLASIRGRHGESWKGETVYIDPALSKWVLPLSLRSSSEALLTLGRGTRIPLGDEPTLRFFVYWKQRFSRTDLDLSALLFDWDGKCTGYVDWTKLSGEGMLHSGDLQSAPLGAAEFIDAKMTELERSSGRYLAACVYRYHGDRFGQMQCFTGWMTRDRPDATYQTFDPATVAQKIELAGEAAYALPFVVDLKEREVLWLDLSVFRLEAQNQVANSFARVEQLVSAGGELTRWMHTLGDLAELHRRARGGETVSDRFRASIVFSVDEGGDYHPGDWSRVLSELL